MWRTTAVLLLVIGLPLRAEQVQIYIDKHYFGDYQKALKGQSVADFRDFKNKKIRRDVVDMILLQQAILEGGLLLEFLFIPVTVNFRKTNWLETGRQLLSVDSYWLQDAKTLEQQVFISQAVIQKGEYLAALLANPENKRVFDAKKSGSLKGLTAVSTPNWTADWLTLNKLPLKKIYREDSWPSMVHIVYEQWADFMLVPMSFKPQDYQETKEFKLEVVPDVALILDDSRHYLVSKSHRLGQKTFQALQKGLTVLRKQGRIKKAYQEAGFFVNKNQILILNR